MTLGFGKQRGGDTVTFGFYWNVAEWQAQVVPAQGGVLKGNAETAYVRLPLPAVLVLAPVMGAVYALFLPFIGFAMVVGYLTGRLRTPETLPHPPAAAAEVLPFAAEKVAKKNVEVEGAEQKRAA